MLLLEHLLSLLHLLLLLLLSGLLLSLLHLLLLLLLLGLLLWAWLKLSNRRLHLLLNWLLNWLRHWLLHWLLHLGSLHLGCLHLWSLHLSVLHLRRGHLLRLRLRLNWLLHLLQLMLLLSMLHMHSTGVCILHGTELHRELSQSLSEAIIFDLHALNLLTKLIIFRRGARVSNAASLSLCTSSLGRSLWFGLSGTVHSSWLRWSWAISVYAAEMLVKVFLTREAFANVTLAVLVWAVELLAWATMLVMDFAFMTKQSTTVGKSWQLLASNSWAFVWAVVLIHMLRPLALPVEMLHCLFASWPVANEATVSIFGYWSIWLWNWLRSARALWILLASTGVIDIVACAQCILQLIYKLRRLRVHSLESSVVVDILIATWRRLSWLLLISWVDAHRLLLLVLKLMLVIIWVALLAHMGELAMLWEVSIWLDSVIHTQLSKRRITVLLLLRNRPNIVTHIVVASRHICR